MLDSQSLADLIAELVGDHVERATAPLVARIAELEGRDAAAPIGACLAAFEAGLPDAVKAMVEPLIEARLAAMPAPVDGRDADPEVIRAMVEAAVAAIPAPRDGQDGKDGAAGKDGRDGRDVDDITVVQKGDTVELAFVVGDTRSIFELALPAGPAGEPGPPGADGKDGQDGAEGPQGPEGPAGAAGKDGEPGRDGADGLNGKDGERGAEGPAGKLAMVRAWSDGVHYEADVVTFKGATWQALRDTGREPGGDDWICLAAPGEAGRDARELTFLGAWSPDSTYGTLDVVALNGASFVATCDDPGACPGEGWRLMAAQGKRGAPGERGVGAKGDKGDPGPPVVAASIDDQGLMQIVNGDGSTVACDLYPVLQKIAR